MIQQIVFLIALLLIPCVGHADVEWSVVKELDLKAQPLDVVSSPDGQQLYILTPGEILKKTAAKIRQISEQYNLDVDPEAYVKDLPVGVQQRVEIIKLLFRDANILILDEPTAVLTPQEVNELFTTMHHLVEKGKSIIVITHKLREVLEFADRITVIRRGKVIGTTKPDQADQGKLAEMMVGRAVKLEVDKQPAQPGENVLAVENLLVLDERHQIAVDDISFEVKAGEILGIAGVQGNGQTQLVGRSVTSVTKTEEKKAVISFIKYSSITR